MTSSRLDIRAATPDDVNTVAALDSLSAERLRRKVEREELLVAVEDARIVGSLRFGFMWDDSPFIHVIVVEEQARGRGIGTSMLTALEQRLRSAGYGRLLSSSECSQARAQHWHRRSGFDEMGILAGLNEGGIGEVFFSKDISA